MNTIAETKSAPFWNSDFAIAVAAYEQLDDTMPKPDARATAAGRWSPSTRCISSLDTKACTAPDRPKPRTSAQSVSQNMKKRLAQAVADVGDAETNADEVRDHDRTRRAMAADASATFSLGVGAARRRARRRRSGRGGRRAARARRPAAPWWPPTTCVEDVDAVRVLVDHALQAAHLALDAAQPLLDVVLVRAVTRHFAASCSVRSIPHGGIAVECSLRGR